MEKAPVNLDLLFETSWEVCNKIGGIYTVLSTKARTLQDLYKDKVLFIGPDVWTEENPSPYFKEAAVRPLAAWLKNVTLPEGLSVRIGRWEVPGRPIAVLVRFDSMYACKDQFYARMWDLYGVDSLHAYGDYDEACAFSHAAGIVIESIYNALAGPKGRVIAHFDEWTTGMGLLYVKDRLPQVATVFTTHATCIGRSICGNGKPLYDQLSNYNGDQMARELNMESKHSLEKAAAHQADSFTTVSTVTATECEQLLERRPDIVTPNGFEKGFVPGRTRFAGSRRRARASLLRVARCLTGADLPDNTFIIGTSGRCEYRNKGLDLFLDAIDRYSELGGATRETVAFLLVPAWSREARADLRARIDSTDPDPDCPLDSPWLTHWLNNPDEDPINCRIASSRLAGGNGKVRVIYTPCYLNGNDGIFDTPYYDQLIGMDATVFPSYYEPWGYTPLESLAFGVPTVTTTLAGFGQWVLDTFTATFDICGVNVIERTDSNYAAVADSIARSLTFLSEADAVTTAEISRKAMAAADKAAWRYFVTYYIDAYSSALAKATERSEACQNKK